MKSRPAFAPMQQDEAEKESLRAFYRKEAQNPEYLTGYEGYQPQQLMKMTHMEPFTYPVWQEDGEMTRMSDKAWVLFDYQNRNPLTYDAAYYLPCISEG